MEGKGVCCPNGSWPALNVDHKSEGQRFEVAGTICYHVGEGDNVLILSEDIWGAVSSRHQSVADTFAKRGFNVYMPWLLDPPYAGDFDMPAILQSIKSQKWETIEKRLDGLLQYLKEKGFKKFHTAGFCWGVYVLFKYANKVDDFINIVGFHPSIGAAGLFGENPDNFVKNVRCPSYFMPAVNDPDNLRTNGEYVNILQQKFGKQKVGSTDFPQMIHGWVVRGDVSKDQNVKHDVEKAINIAVQYLGKFK